MIWRIKILNTFDANIGDLMKRLEEIIHPTLQYRSIEKDYSESRNVNSEICAECGGRCCKKCGCHFSPDDFKEISFEFLKNELEKGYISIDHVDGEMIYQDFGVDILRIRNKGAPVVDFTYKRSQCILLTENGCKLDYEHRPTGGKLLIPSAEVIQLRDRTERSCHHEYDIMKCCYEWQPHQRILHRLVEYFKGKEIPCSL